MSDLAPERVVAANARQLREAHGYTQEHVAQLMTEAGYPTGEMPLWALEKGKRRIKVADLFGLAAAFDLPAESLLSPLLTTSEPDKPQPPIYELAVGDDTRCTVRADAVSVDDHGFLNFYARGTRIFFAPVAAVLFCRVIEESVNA